MFFLFARKIVVKCPHLARIGRLDILVFEQICSCGNEMVKSMWQTINTFDLIHSSYKWIPAILFCENTAQHSTTLQIRIDSRFWFCKRPWKFVISIRRHSVHFRKSHVRANNLDVQEADLSFPQFCKSWNIFPDAGLRMDGIAALDLWDLVIEVFHLSPNQLNNTKGHVQGNLSHDTTSNKHTQNKTKVPTQHDNFDLNDVDHVRSNATFSPFGAILYIFEDDEVVILKWASKDEVQQWDMFHGPTELLWMGCLLGWIWTPKIKSSMSTRHTNLQTRWQKGNFTRDEWNNLLVQHQ